MSAPAQPPINFGIGQPSRDLLPVTLFERMARSCAQWLQPQQLNYGDYAGDEVFLAALVEFLTRHYGAPADPATLFLTAGASQAIDLACRLHCAPGDVVLVEEPTYFLALNIFASHNLRVVPVAMDEQGLRADALEAALAQHRARLVYTIPLHHNPTAFCMSAGRRQEVLSLTRAAGVPLLADEVYQLLHFADDPPPPPFALQAAEGGVISAGSFSKILGPGMRVGWIQSDAGTIERLCAEGFVRSGGAVNQIGSLLVAAALRSGLQDEHLTQLVLPTLHRRAQVMHAALSEALSGTGAAWEMPSGGYFFWVRLPAGVTGDALLAKCQAAGAVAFHPGSRFTAGDAQDGYLRLSFANYGEDEIREGIGRLGEVLAAYLQ